jgi:ATP-dependent Clp protease ATP-binding subunit ClpA
MPYRLQLPYKFVHWYFVKIPSKIFRIGKVLFATANNKFSFVYNIKLLFVPLFGIQNITGRIVSFFARIFMIFFGFIVMVSLSIAMLIIPTIWFLIPVLIFYKLNIIFTILYFLLLFIYWTLSNLRKPEKKISQISAEKDQIKSFRPDTKYYLTRIGPNPNEILNNLLEDQDIILLLKRSELDLPQFIEKIRNSPAIKVEDIVNRSFQYAKTDKCRYVEKEHLFFSLIENIPNIKTILSTFNSDIDTIRKTVLWVVEERERLSKVYFWQDDYVFTSPGGIGKGMLGRVTPNLDANSIDITKEVNYGRVEKIVGREEEIKKISEILDGEKNDILIVGESGVGKTSIIRGIAYQIIAGTEYKTLKNKRIVSLDTGSLISSEGGITSVAEKLTTILKEVEASGDIILFIDEIQNLVTGMGERGGYDSTLFSMMESYISRKRIRVIGAVSLSNFRKYIEPNDAVSRLFHIIKINESSIDDTLEILKQMAKRVEREHGILVTYPAINSSIELSEKLIGDKVLPDKAIDLIQRTATSVKNSTKILTSKDVSKEISEMTSIPVTEIGHDESEKLLNITENMKKGIIGQDQAIEKIGIALQRARTGMRDEKKPIAAFLFVGLTGVGKTETAKVLLSNYFGTDENLIRLDMSEYQQIDSLNRIIGTPEGYTSGSLTEKVRNKPFSLILIDEIEKAHPNILLTFLQMLDEGRLTDTAGNEANFTNTIIVATSNVGTKSIQAVSEKGGDYQKMQESAMLEIRKKFTPELLNRFTAIIVFNPLSVENLKEITGLMLERVKNTASEKGIEISFKPELILELIKRGYSPEWGARPLARVIEDSVESYIALKILKKEIKPGDRIMLGTEVFSI